MHTYRITLHHNTFNTSWIELPFKSDMCYSEVFSTWAQFLGWLTWSTRFWVLLLYWIQPLGRPWMQSGGQTWLLGKRLTMFPPARSQQGAVTPTSTCDLQHTIMNTDSFYVMTLHKMLGNSPLDRDHRLPSLSPPWSGCRSPGFLQKTPRWVSADHDSRFPHTLIQ